MLHMIRRDDRTMPRLWALLLALALLAVHACARSNEPSIEVTKFKSLPTQLFFFDDSDVVIVTDTETRTAYRSEDAGVKWKKLEGVKGEVTAPQTY